MIHHLAFCAKHTLLCAVLFALAACGGGGGGAVATYTLGGTLSGLSVGGLVLGNGADTVSPAAQAISFTLPNALAQGSAYNVTVQTDPLWLSCLVANGSGIMGATNASSVAVTCADAEGNVSTLAGSSRGYINGIGTDAQFNSPIDVAVDGSGNVLVVEMSRIRRITPDGTVSTLAGSDPGYVDGVGAGALFNGPRGVAVDAGGNVLVADSLNHRIRKITPDGTVSTLAGSSAGFTDGSSTEAQFNYPSGLAVDASGNVLVADNFNDRIRKITPDGTVSTLAGSTYGFADGTVATAQFGSPYDVAVDASGNVLIADSGNNRIRKIAPDGMVSTLAGSSQGFADGTGAAAQFSYPNGVAVDAAGNVLVADVNNLRIRKITPDSTVSTLAGSTFGFADGPGAAAQFGGTYGVAVDASGNVYVADIHNQRIRKISR